MYYLFPLRKDVAIKNLEIAFPKKTSKEIKKILLNSYMHYGLLMFEFLRNSTKKTTLGINSINNQTEEILLKNESLIYMTAHLGNWEMSIPILSQYKKMLVVVKEQSNSGGDRFFNKARKYKNVRLISKKGSKRIMLKSLYENSILALASDQNAKKRGIYIDFFNKPASIPKGAGHFYALTKTRIVIGFCILNEKLEYDFNLEYLDIQDNLEQKDEIIVKVSELYVEKLEKMIIKHPEQYFWFHKKWDKKIYDL